MNCCGICGNPLLWFSLLVVISRLYAYFYPVNTNFVIEALLLMIIELLLCDWVNYDCGALSYHRLGLVR